ncbi:MAG: HAMP domain-containing sensor histidine kinase [Acidobacteriota bacterium]
MEVENEEINELKRINNYLLQLAGAGLAAERQKHEFNRMIRSLRASLGKLKKLSDEADSKMQDEIHNLQNIIETIASSLSANDKEIIVKLSGIEKELDLKTVVENSLKILDHQIDKNKIEVSVDGESFNVKMPEGALMQVITNLISNSVDSLNQPFAEIKKIKIILENSKRTMFLCDNGEGIPQILQDKIFQIFFTTKENQGGKGIGLHLVKELLEKRNYTITLANHSDHKELLDGACFKITF